MKRQVLLLVSMLAWAMAIPAQETVTVKFTAVNETGQHSPFTSVVATNETRGWTDTLTYPDTILVLSHAGVSEHAGVGFSIGTAYPNPFTDETRVPLELSEACEVQLRVVGVDGTVPVSCSRYLEAGSHCVAVRLSEAGLAFLTVATPNGGMVCKLIGMGDGGGNSLDVEAFPAKAARGEKAGSTRGNAPGEFVPGDMMRYEALMELYGMTLHSEVVTQEQYDSETVILRYDTCFEYHEYVDLGLPSGLLWAACNVGANSPEEYGDYFAWGETQPKDYYDWSTYQYCNGDYDQLTKYCNNSIFGYNGFTDSLNTLLPEDDAATANWGSDWRMPSQAEWEELLDNTTVTWTWNMKKGVSGRLFTASNGNSLFLPAAGYRNDVNLYNAVSFGYYWSSSLSTVYSHYAWHLYFYLDFYYMDQHCSRARGRSVRPVRAGLQN